MEHLLSIWPQIIEQIQKARHILFLSDFDGTLTPLVEKPELATLSEDIRELLQSLELQENITVGIISGRAISDLKSKINLSNIVYAGNHGLEIEGPGLNFISPLTDEIKPFFRVIRQILNLTLGTVKGVLVEDKGVSLSVHYRQVEDQDAVHIKQMVEDAVNGPAARSIFKVIPGKKVYEVRPAINWDKGKAIRLLMKRCGKGGRYSGLLPIYLGDDLTDEDGFQILEKYGESITVHVGGYNVDSVARYYLNSPAEVQQFLYQLTEYAERGWLCERYSTA